MVTENNSGKFSTDGFSYLSGLLKNGVIFSVEITKDNQGNPDFNYLCVFVKRPGEKERQLMFNLSEEICEQTSV